MDSKGRFVVSVLSLPLEDYYSFLHRITIAPAGAIARSRRRNIILSCHRRFSVCSSKNRCERTGIVFHIEPEKTMCVRCVPDVCQMCVRRNRLCFNSLYSIFYSWYTWYTLKRKNWVYKKKNKK